MSEINFPTHLEAIASRLENLDPVAYGRTRNFSNGDLSYLSPYISRGVLSGRQVVDALLQRGYHMTDMEKFVQQLAWREYFQRTWQVLGDDMFEDIRRRNTGVRHRQLPLALEQAATGIEAVDTAIHELKRTGYMHNHLRLYTASIACNIGKAWWPAPAEWMYYHLLDGDLASNACSWQWVSGHFSAKQYYCNQDNINHYTGSRQKGTYLDSSYEALPHLDIPATLRDTVVPAFSTPLPEKKMPVLDPALPLHLYTSYNLDPHWRQQEEANRVLLLEPSHFRRFPVSEKVVSFITGLAENIPGLQVFTGEVSELTNRCSFPAIRSKEHPAFEHFPGTKDERDWLFPAISGWFPSFFSFWKQASRQWNVKEQKVDKRIRA